MKLYFTVITFQHLFILDIFLHFSRKLQIKRIELCEVNNIPINQQQQHCSSLNCLQRAQTGQYIKTLLTEIKFVGQYLEIHSLLYKDIIQRTQIPEYNQNSQYVIIINQFETQFILQVDNTIYTFTLNETFDTAIPETYIEQSMYSITGYYKQQQKLTLFDYTPSFQYLVFYHYKVNQEINNINSQIQSKYECKQDTQYEIASYMRPQEDFYRFCKYYDVDKDSQYLEAKKRQNKASSIWLMEPNVLKDPNEICYCEENPTEIVSLQDNLMAAYYNNQHKIKIYYSESYLWQEITVLYGDSIQFIQNNKFAICYKNIQIIYQLSINIPFDHIRYAIADNMVHITDLQSNLLPTPMYDISIYGNNIVQVLGEKRINDDIFSTIICQKDQLKRVKYQIIINDTYEEATIAGCTAYEEQKIIDEQNRLEDLVNFDQKQNILIDQDGYDINLECKDLFDNNFYMEYDKQTKIIQEEIIYQCQNNEYLLGIVNNYLYILVDNNQVSYIKQFQLDYKQNIIVRDNCLFYQISDVKVQLKIQQNQLKVYFDDQLIDQFFVEEQMQLYDIIDNNVILYSKNFYMDIRKINCLYKLLQIQAYLEQNYEKVKQFQYESRVTTSYIPYKLQFNEQQLQQYFNFITNNYTQLNFEIEQVPQVILFKTRQNQIPQYYSINIIYQFIYTSKYIVYLINLLCNQQYTLPTIEYCNKQLQFFENEYYDFQQITFSQNQIQQKLYDCFVLPLKNVLLNFQHIQYKSQQQNYQALQQNLLFFSYLSSQYFISIYYGPLNDRQSKCEIMNMISCYYQYFKLNNSLQQYNKFIQIYCNRNDIFEMIIDKYCSNIDQQTIQQIGKDIQISQQEIQETYDKINKQQQLKINNNYYYIMQILLNNQQRNLLSYNSIVDDLLPYLQQILNEQNQEKLNQMKQFQSEEQISVKSNILIIFSKLSRSIQFENIYDEYLAQMYKQQNIKEIQFLLDKLDCRTIVQNLLKALLAKGKKWESKYQIIEQIKKEKESNNIQILQLYNQQTTQLSFQTFYRILIEIVTKENIFELVKITQQFLSNNDAVKELNNKQQQIDKICNDQQKFIQKRLESRKDIQQEQIQVELTNNNSFKVLKQKQAQLEKELQQLTVEIQYQDKLKQLLPILQLCN